MKLILSMWFSFVLFFFLFLSQASEFLNTHLGEPAVTHLFCLLLAHAFFESWSRECFVWSAGQNQRLSTHDASAGSWEREVLMAHL